MHRYGLEAETARDLILDADAAAILTDVYTPQERAEMLDKIESYLQSDLISYALFYSKLVDDLEKAEALRGILERRAVIFNSSLVILDSDRELLRMMIERLR